MVLRRKADELQGASKRREVAPKYRSKPGPVVGQTRPWMRDEMRKRKRRKAAFLIR